VLGACYVHIAVVSLKIALKRQQIMLGGACVKTVHVPRVERPTTVGKKRTENVLILSSPAYFSLLS
jgi:hypothetical protein